uniref:BAG6 n=1 Tax=Arundo donax TaxID=35708 RepID=A0A0A8Y3E1_ARUDO
MDSIEDGSSYSRLASSSTEASTVEVGATVWITLRALSSSSLLLLVQLDSPDGCLHKESSFSCRQISSRATDFLASLTLGCKPWIVSSFRSKFIMVSPMATCSFSVGFLEEASRLSSCLLTPCICSCTSLIFRSLSKGCHLRTSYPLYAD